MDPYLYNGGSNGVPNLSKIPIIAASCGLTFIVWGIAFARRDPPPQPQTESKYLSLQKEPTLQQRWDEGQWDPESTAPLVKGPRLVQTVKVAPDAVEAAEIKQLESPEQPAHHYRKKVKRERTRSDVCGRHHMRKVYTRGGKSWRCRR